MTLLVAWMFVAALTSPADEGMWLFNQPPRQLLREHHQFDATDAWLGHLQRASVRFNSGGSGSFVSADGLLISNHHVGADALQKLSSEKTNFLRDGFYARTPAAELKCLDLELNVLQSITDVTARVNAAVPADAGADDAFAARRRVMADIEKEASDGTDLRADVVTLWEGGGYQLYRYKRYTDVRIVFAPEQQIAYFGGDPDNFEFPRCDLDICLFRAYENNHPVRVADWLKFNPAGPREGDLVFVSGHPGGTSRLRTAAELVNDRDRAVPFRLNYLKRRERLLENARRAHAMLLGVQNGRKALDGRLAGLLDPDLMGAKVREEASFKARLAGQPAFAGALEAYDKIAQATQILAGQAEARALLDGGMAFGCESFRLARTLLRAGDERPKPNGERLREFSDAGRTSLELALFSARPIYPDLEILTLSDSLTDFATRFGGDDPLVRAVLAGKTPHARAVELIYGSQVRDPAMRRQLYAGGAGAVAAAHDPMIELARLVDARARELRRLGEDQNEVMEQAHAALARARNALGNTGYPDATSTLRLSFGTVQGYTEDDGTPVPAFTDYADLYARAGRMAGQPPFDLPPRWKKAAARRPVKTPLDFVSTADIIGGNSGSPVVNRAGEFVGIIFDGNLQSLPWDYAFSGQQGRATAVDAAAIAEALARVYAAPELAAELVHGRRGR